MPDVNINSTRRGLVPHRAADHFAGVTRRLPRALGKRSATAIVATSEAMRWGARTVAQGGRNG